MLSKFNSFRHSLLASAVIVALSSLPAASLKAQESNNTIEISIPAKPLGEALVELANTTGLTIVATNELVRGKQSPALIGRYSPEQALNKMLEGSGLVASPSSTGAFIVSALTSQEGEGELLQLAPIVVQGELIERAIDDVQTSVSIVDGVEFDERAETDIKATITRLPNISSADGIGGLSIRGITQFGQVTSFSSLAIATSIDGIVKPDFVSVNNSTLPTWDLDRVEVLRGPQSTQQGPSALAGAVIYQTANPEYENRFRIRGQYGSRNSHDIAAMANIVLVEDKLAFRISAQDNSDDGNITSTVLNDDKFGFKEYTNIRGKLRFNPFDKFEGVLSHTYQDNQFGDRVLLNDSFPEQRITEADTPTFTDFEENITTLDLSYSHNNLITVSSVTGYYTYERVSERDFEIIAQNDGFVSNNPEDSSTLQQELKLSYSKGEANAVLGVFYRKLDTDVIGATVFPGAAVGLPSGFIVNTGITRNIDAETVAIFGEVTTPLEIVSKNLTITAGARWEDENVDRIEGRTTSVVPTPPFSPPPDSFNEIDANYNVFLPKLALQYRFDNKLTAGIKYEEGYRAGGAVINPFTGGIIEYDPEFLKNYELSLNKSFFNDSLNARLNVFYSEYTDQQIQFQNESGRFISNAAKSDSQGAELQLNYYPATNLNIFGAFGYTKAEFVDYVDITGDFTGNRLPDAPEITASAGFFYEMNEHFTAGADIAYTDSAFTDRGNNPDLESQSRMLVNTTLSYTSGSIRTGIFVRNLFDEDYLLDRFFIDRLLIGPLAATPGEERTIGIFIEYEY